MGGKITSTYKINSSGWMKSRKQRSSLFAKFLNIILYTKNNDLLPHSILLEEIPFPTGADNWSMQEYHIWLSLLELLDIRSNNGHVKKVELNERTYIEMKHINDMYDEGFDLLIEHLSGDYYYWKNSHGILEDNDDIRSLSPVSSNSDRSTVLTISTSSSLESHPLSNILPPKKQFGDNVPFEKVEELLSEVRSRYEVIREKKWVGNVWVWKKSNRDSRNSNSEMSNLPPNLQLLNL